MEATKQSKNSKPRATKQKAKLQQIMSISIENLSKKNNTQVNTLTSLPEQQQKEQEQQEINQEEFNKISEQEYKEQLDAYYLEQNKRFSFSQPIPDPQQIQIKQQQQQFQQILNRQQDSSSQSPTSQRQQQQQQQQIQYFQQPLLQSQQLYKSQLVNQQKGNETMISNFTQKSPIFIPQLHISQINQLSNQDQKSIYNIKPQEELFQMTSQLDESQDIPQIHKMSIKSDNVKKEQKNKNGNINNILDNFLSHRQKLNDQSAINQSELFESSHLQNFGGGQNEQSVIHQQQSVNQSIHNETADLFHDQIQQNDEFQFKNQQVDEIDDLLQTLYEQTTKQLQSNIIETNPKQVKQKAKEVISNVFDIKKQKNEQQQTNIITGSNFMSEQQPENLSPVVKNNLQDVAQFSAEQVNSIIEEQSHLTNEFDDNKQKSEEKSNELSDSKKIDQPIIFEQVKQQLKESNQITIQQQPSIQKYQSIQDKLKNSLKVKEVQQQQTYENIVNPFQINSQEQIIKQSHAFELTFRIPETKNILSISQYLFKEPSLLIPPDQEKLNTIQIDKVKQYYKDQKLEIDKFDLKTFENQLKEKNTDFLELCKTNLFLFQSGITDNNNNNKWINSYLLKQNLQSYLFSIGFTLNTQQINSILNLIEQQQKKNNNVTDELNYEQVLYSIFLAFQNYPDFNKLQEVLKFFSNQDTNEIDIQTAKMILSKLLEKKQIEYVFQCQEQTINYETIFKIMSLLQY